MITKPHAQTDTERKHSNATEIDCNVLDSRAFVFTTELFERANQIVACPITGVTHWCTSACVDANWW